MRTDNVRYKDVKLQSVLLQYIGFTRKNFKEFTMKDFTLIIGPRYFEILRDYTLYKQKKGKPSLGELPSWIYISKDIKQKLKLWLRYVRQKTHMEVHITWTGPEQYEVGFHNRWPNKTKIKINKGKR